MSKSERLHTRTILYTPLVIYSWTTITEALIEEGVVQVGEDGVYRVDMLALLALIESGQTWARSGFRDRTEQDHGATNRTPTRALRVKCLPDLLANTMNCLEVVDG